MRGTGEPYPMLHHSDLVGPSRSGQTMGDEDDGLRLSSVALAPCAGDSVQSVEYLALGV